MKTLVIHPYDPSTSFMRRSYEGKGCIEITAPNPSSGHIRRSIKDADRVIMIGHGSKDGLFSGDQSCPVISSKLVQLLRQKECIAIWCHAKKFCEKYGLNAFGTDMFISEYEEALQYCVPATLDEIRHNCDEFALLLQRCIDAPIGRVFWYMKSFFKSRIPVGEFNHSGLFLNYKQWKGNHKSQ